MKVAINGFGRIGRSIFKICLERGVNVVAINAVHGAKDAAYLLKYDSIYGKYDKKVVVKGNNLVIGNKNIKVISERDPTKLPWKELGVTTVIEATGVFAKDPRKLKSHLKSGAKKVIVTAPSKGVEITIVPGVNDDKLKKSHKILSVASCTTNAAAIITKILNDEFGIKNALLTTIHAYTDSQKLLGGSHKSPRRGRAAALNIIPTTTGASKSVCEVIPSLKGKLNGIAVRVPVADGSLIDLVADLKKPFTVKQINNIFKKYSKKKLKGILEYTTEHLVSSDVIGNSNSAILDSLMTHKEGDLVKVLAWYDNEYGYSARVVDVIKKLK